MTEFRHTPGPWVWHKRDKSCNGELLLVHPHRGFLAVMDFARHGMQGGQPRFATWKGDQRENMGGIMRPAKELDVAAHPDAMVMAAAPELLESCEALLAIVIDAIMYGMPVTPAVADARNNAVAAINKAIGTAGPSSPP